MCIYIGGILRYEIVEKKMETTRVYRGHRGII